MVPYTVNSLTRGCIEESISSTTNSECNGDGRLTKSSKLRPRSPSLLTYARNVVEEGESKLRVYTKFSSEAIKPILLASPDAAIAYGICVVYFIAILV